MYRIPKWLTRLYNAIPMNPGFIYEMNKQLSIQFKSMTHYDLANNFILMNHFPVPFKIINEGEIYSLNGDLIGSHMGHLIQISWKLLGENKVWQPNDNISSDKIEFWWEYLPVGEIVDEEKKKYEPLFDTNTFNFSVETEIGVWPYLCLEIICKNNIDIDKLNEYKDIFYKSQEEWNSKGGGHGIIHSIGKIIHVEDNCFQVKIDFGSAVKSGLEYILNTLNNKNNKIDKIKIYSC